MPLDKSGSKGAFSANVKKEIESGRPTKQALAIAYAVKSEAKKKKKTKDKDATKGKDKDNDKDRKPEPKDKPKASKMPTTWKSGSGGYTGGA